MRADEVTFRSVIDFVLVTFDDEIGASTTPKLAPTTPGSLLLYAITAVVAAYFASTRPAPTRAGP